VKDNVAPTISDQILTALEASDASLTEADLLETVRGRRQEKVKVLRALVDSGGIHRAGSGKRGDPFRYNAPSVGGSHQQTECEVSAAEGRGRDQNVVVEPTAPPQCDEGKPCDPEGAAELKDNRASFNQYNMPDGSQLHLSKDEFDNFIAAFRLLLSESIKTGPK